MRSLMGRCRQSRKSSAEARGPDSCPCKAPERKNIREPLLLATTHLNVFAAHDWKILACFFIAAKNLVTEGEEMFGGKILPHKREELSSTQHRKSSEQSKSVIPGEAETGGFLVLTGQIA